MVLLFVAVLLAFSSGVALVGACVPFRVCWNRATFFWASIGLGLGLAVTSMTWFVAWWAFHASMTAALLLETVFLALAGFASLTRARYSECFPAVDLDNDQCLMKAVAITSAGVAVSLSVLYFCRFAALLPHGEWDAWSIWNLRARFIYLGSEAWRTAFSPELAYSHPDYPPLVPMSIVRLWTFEGAMSPLGPQVIAFAFTFGTAGLLASAVTLLRGSVQGCLALTALLGTNFYVHLGAAQYADIPTTFFVTAAVTLLACSHESGRPSPGLVALSGVSAGFACCTKNEGWLLLIAMVTAIAVTSRKRRSGRIHWRELLWFWYGAAAPVAIAVAYKALLAPEGDVSSWRHDPAVWSRVLDVNRFVTIVRTLAIECWKWGGWFPSMVLILVLYVVCCGITHDRAQRSTVFSSAVVLMVIALGYIAIYQYGRPEIGWWLSVTATRLMMHLWPATLFVFFIAVKPPCAVWLPRSTPKEDTSAIKQR